MNNQCHIRLQKCILFYTLDYYWSNITFISICDTNRLEKNNFFEKITVSQPAQLD